MQLNVRETIHYGSQVTETMEVSTNRGMDKEYVAFRKKLTQVDKTLSSKLLHFLSDVALRLQTDTGCRCVCSMETECLWKEQRRPTGRGVRERHVPEHGCPRNAVTQEARVTKNIK